jgi:hypothetical protein
VALQKTHIFTSEAQQSAPARDTNREGGEAEGGVKEREGRQWRGREIKIHKWMAPVKKHSEREKNER